MTGLVLAVQLLHVERIMLIPHTRCAMSGTDEALHQSIAERNGMDATWLSFGASPDQMSRLKQDVSKAPAICGRARREALRCRSEPSTANTEAEVDGPQ